MSDNGTLETAEDRAREIEVCEHVSQVWNIHAVRQPPYAPIDAKLYALPYVSANPQQVGWAEVKCRFDLRYGDYGTIIFSFDRWRKLVDTEVRTGLPGYIVWRLDDDGMRTLFMRATDVHRISAVKMGGRTDRGRETDREPMIHVPWNETVHLLGSPVPRGLRRVIGVASMERALAERLGD